MTRIQGEWRYFDDELGIPFPWYTRPCLEWLTTLDLNGKLVFEYGVGASTTWYKRKHAFCYGVDNNPAWAAQHQSVFETEESLYRRSIFWAANDKPDKKVFYDIVVVDGAFRDRCTDAGLKFLKPGGYLIIDNYKQESVPCDWTQTEKLIEGMDVKYFKEPGHHDWQTIVVTK